MADIYILKMSSCKDTLISLRKYLSERRQKLFDGILIEDSKLFNIASEVILAYALCLPLPCPYQTDQNGKPYITGQRHFNISHSGDFIACAVSDFEIGVDVEKTERMSPRLIYKFLADAEIKELENIDEKQISLYLCEKWVRKEAYLKLTGTGLRVSPTTLCFEGDKLLGDRSVFSRVLPISDDHLISVCSFKDTKINIIELSAEELKRIRLN